MSNNEISSIREPQIIEDLINKAADGKHPKVLVRCIAYNQEAYIRETLNGFVMQKTDFSFVAIVHDDASTDGTPSIIQEYAERYPEIIVPICDPVNRHTEHTLGFILDEIIGAYNPEYVAICEGDDCWIDPQKLQKQVDYMDNHEECVLCHSDYDLINGTKRKTPPHYDDEPYFGAEHKHIYNISALTVLYRYSAYKRIPNYRNSHNWLMGDYPLWIELSREGKFHYFPEVFGKYRILPNTYSHSTNGEKIKNFWNCWNEITEFYSNLYGYSYTERSRKSLYLEIQKQCYKNKDKKQAKQYWKEGKIKKANSLKSFTYYVGNVWHMRWLVEAVYRFVK